MNKQRLGDVTTVDRQGKKKKEKKTEKSEFSTSIVLSSAKVYY